MNRTVRIILIIACIIAAYLLIVGIPGSGGLNFADLEHSDGQKQFEKKLMAKQQVLDSLAKIYRGTFVTLSIPAGFNGNTDKIILNGTSGMDTLAPGESVQLIDVLPQYQFRTNDVPRVLRGANTKVKTKKGVTVIIPHYYIDDFESVLKEKGLETDLH